MATCRVTGQESAEAIVGTGPHLDWVVENEPRESKAGRSHLAEGPNKEKGRCPSVLLRREEPDRGAVGGAALVRPTRMQAFEEVLSFGKSGSA
jgi:hypothetical protein